jgi:hypothetical protein
MRVCVHGKGEGIRKLGKNCGKYEIKGKERKKEDRQKSKREKV